MDITWKDGNATRVKLVSNQGQPVKVLYKNLRNAKLYVNDILTDVSVDSNDVVTLNGANGTTYVIDFDGSYTPTSVKQPTADAASADGKTYNVSGQLVADSHKGIVIRNGKKLLNR